MIRCAIYTRKSSEEGLEQSFNSLDAQRESKFELYEERSGFCRHHHPSKQLNRSFVLVCHICQQRERWKTGVISARSPGFARRLITLRRPPQRIVHGCQTETSAP